MIFKIHLLFLCKVCALCLQASLATVHNLWIAGTIACCSPVSSGGKRRCSYEVPCSA